MATPATAVITIDPIVVTSTAQSNRFKLDATVHKGGATVSYCWSKDPIATSGPSPSARQGNGPGPVKFDTPFQEDTYVTLDVIGPYTLTLAVTDNAHPNVSVRRDVTINYVAPIDPAYRAPDTHLEDFLTEQGAEALTVQPTNNPFVFTGQGVAVANAYYAAVDPGNDEDTLAKFEAKNGIDASRPVGVRGAGGTSGVAAFMNAADLGDGLRIAFNVKNGVVAFTFTAFESALEAALNVNAIQSTALEYSPGGPGHPAAFTKFYAFNFDPQKPDDHSAAKRVPAANFDHRANEPGGYKIVPNLCSNCHGGRPASASSIIGGVYPNSGDIGASFPPIDLDALEFTCEFPRAAQEAVLKDMNKAVIAANPTPAIVSLIRGWYGGTTLPYPTAHTDYIPAEFTGNSVDRNLYSQVLAKSCRSCHDSVESQIITLRGFIAARHDVQELVFGTKNMPHAIPTFDRFWLSTAPHQPDVLKAALTFHGP